ncbi:hypothetical protein LEP1GSC073_2992 [Leptospira noguchii str. Cascata]|nr:hypothetical protein LEP1GSC072_0049 [Leptospira noguchii str. Bonito]EMS84583.1 hypothetical protein LEP1GSC073_2992 [Leptospira noguchii str. Cascata]
MNPEVDKYQMRLKNRIKKFSSKLTGDSKWMKFFRILSIIETS